LKFLPRNKKLINKKIINAQIVFQYLEPVFRFTMIFFFFGEQPQQPAAAFAGQWPVVRKNRANRVYWEIKEAAKGKGVEERKKEICWIIPEIGLRITFIRV
jgi:hypothetical protein